MADLAARSMFRGEIAKAADDRTGGDQRENGNGE
jgi:hypothetical protein